MFQTLTLSGSTGSINWGYRSAAALQRWKVTRARDEKSGQVRWTLSAALGAHVDHFQLRQRPLLFTAPRRGGFWCWPVREVTVGATSVSANLDPPEY
jgi:hypothetical protein